MGSVEVDQAVALDVTVLELLFHPPDIAVVGEEEIDVIGNPGRPDGQIGPRPSIPGRLVIDADSPPALLSCQCTQISASLAVGESQLQDVTGGAAIPEPLQGSCLLQCHVRRVVDRLVDFFHRDRRCSVARQCSSLIHSKESDSPDGLAT